MNCSNCDGNNSGGGFCPRCGYVNDTPVAAARTGRDPPDSETASRQRVVGIVAVGLVILFVATRSNGNNKPRSAVPIADDHVSGESTSKAALDVLDILPSRPGELAIRTAWRISNEAVGVYDWPSAGTDVQLTCALPPPYDSQCDESAPLHLKFGDVSACAAARDEPGQGSGRTGPMIIWRTCFLSVAKAGTEAPRHFKQMKAAAAAAIAWSERVIAFSSRAPDMDAVMKNRAAGLLAATRVGNVQRNLNISHQLDVAQ